MLAAFSKSFFASSPLGHRRVAFGHAQKAATGVVLLSTYHCSMKSVIHEAGVAFHRARNKTINEVGVVIQWNPSIVAAIGERLFGHYRGVATSQGFLSLYKTKLE